VEIKDILETPVLIMKGYGVRNQAMCCMTIAPVLLIERPTQLELHIQLATRLPRYKP
jgi:hypothetical protein